MDNKLRKYRIKNGYTQKEMAKLLNMPYRTYQNYDEGRNRLSLWLEDLIFFKLNTIIKYDESLGIYKLKQIKYISIPIFLKYHITNAILFGSYATKRMKQTSNIDFLIKGDIPTFSQYQLKNELEEAFNKRISIYYFKDYDPKGEFIKKAYKEGTTLFDIKIK